MSRPVDQGSVVKLTFRTYRGTVLGTAEMLIPVARTQQPFRFLALPESDQRTLQAAFQSGLYRNTDEEEWMEEFKAAPPKIALPQPRPFGQKFLQCDRNRCGIEFRRIGRTPSAQVRAPQFREKNGTNYN